MELFGGPPDIRKSSPTVMQLAASLLEQIISLKIGSVVVFLTGPIQIVEIGTEPDK